ncbi:hypothetical protein M405DRAFT_881705 [Rhizopogon salebrosus TDB-379]|nr:hypothetical protein M405DRAFT_881705 [Rhizopogon salebrosus TDB-379]
MPFRKISHDVKLAPIQSSGSSMFMTFSSAVDSLNALDHEDSIKFTPAYYLLRLVRQNPHYFLDELMHLLKTVDSSPSSSQQSSRELECAGLSLYRKFKRIAQERNENLRAEFIARIMAQYDPTVLGFVDDTSKDERMPGRRYCRRWRRCYERRNWCCAGRAWACGPGLGQGLSGYGLSNIVAQPKHWAWAWAGLGWAEAWA